MLWLSLSLCVEDCGDLFYWDALLKEKLDDGEFLSVDSGSCNGRLLGLLCLR